MISGRPEFRDPDLLLRDGLSYVCRKLVPLGCNDVGEQPWRRGRCVVVLLTFAP